MASNKYSTRKADVHPLDRLIHAAMGRVTLGISPSALMLAYLDWLIHLGIAPAKQYELLDKGTRKAWRCNAYVVRALLNRGDVEPCIEPLPQDKRFAAPEWMASTAWPISLLSCP